MRRLHDSRLGASIVITNGMDAHPPYSNLPPSLPGTPGEGRTLADAASHLVNQLICGLDFVHGSEREAVERAVAEVRAFRSSRPRHRPWALAAVP